MKMTCPNCGDDCSRDEVHNGVAMLYGPWGCSCGWSEDPFYNVREHLEAKAAMYPDHYIDQWGGATRKQT